jgi:hypothetical protein
MGRGSSGRGAVPESRDKVQLAKAKCGGGYLKSSLLASRGLVLPSLLDWPAGPPPAFQRADRAVKALPPLPQKDLPPLLRYHRHAILSCYFNFFMCEMQKFFRVIVPILVSAAILTWVGTVNGYPFFYPDTTNYVRATDAAVTRLMGPQFATVWTLSDTELSTHDAIGFNSVKNGTVLAGRSPYYGALIYLGERAHSFWITEFLQGLILSAVSFILIVRGLGITPRAFLITMALLALTSGVSFFVSFLMPDIFAAIAIIAITGILACWDRLSKFELTLLSGLLIFSILSHFSVLLISTITVAACAIIQLAGSLWRGFSIKAAPYGLLAASIVTAALGELLFLAVVTSATGFPPIRPPFVTAKLVGSLPGIEYLKAHCGEISFTVCQYKDRLPLGTDPFLWSSRAELGAFYLADPHTKQQLSKEDLPLGFRVLINNPLGVFAQFASDGAKQLGTFGLSEFQNCEGCEVGLETRIPEKYQSRIEHTLLVKYPDVITWYDWFSKGIVGLSLAYLGAVIIRSFLVNDPKEHGDQKNLRLIYFIALTGVVANGLVCGAFSALHDRYQARVIWLIPFLALLTFINRVDLSFQKKSRAGISRTCV